MSMSQRLNRYIEYGLLSTNETIKLAKLSTTHKYRSVPDPSCWVGIEIEVENLAPRTVINSDWWNVTNDGSLRENGKEFVFHPLRNKCIEHALLFFEEHLTKTSSKHKFSSRTSVHIHVGVRYLTVEQLLNMVFCYIALENVFYLFSKTATGFARNENNFCVPITESKLALDLPFALSLLSTDEAVTIRTLAKAWKKYTGFNLAPIGSLGTVEFRHLGGTCDPKIILDWIFMIQNLRLFSMNHTLDEVRSKIFNLNTNSSYLPFIQEVLGNSLDIQYHQAVELMEENVAQLKEIYAAPITKLSVETEGEKLANVPLYRKLSKWAGPSLIEISGGSNREYLGLLRQLDELNISFNSGVISKAKYLEDYTKISEDMSKFESSALKFNNRIRKLQINDPLKGL